MSTIKIKQGTIREDGMVFWAVQHGKQEWITQEKYQKRLEKRRMYRRCCQEHYKENQAKKSAMDRNYIGKYDFSKNLYFIRVTSSGKEQWGTKEELDRYRQIRNKASYSRFLRLKKIQDCGLRTGDRNPNNPDEYVIFVIGVKPYFGTYKKLQEHLQSRNVSYRKRNIKYQKIRRDILAKITNKIKRGTIHSETGLIFWIYDAKGKERWITKQDFDHKMEQERIRKVNYAKRKKGESDVATEN